MSCCAFKLSLQYNFIYSTDKISLLLTNTKNANHDTSSGIDLQCKLKLQMKNYNPLLSVNSNQKSTPLELLLFINKIS